VADNNRLGAEDLERFALIGRIASGLAHELNGPIGVAIGFTELARETIDSAGTEGLDPAGTRKVADYLGLIGDAGLRARSLTRLMWSFAKARPGTVEDFDVAEALTQASNLATPALKVAQIEAHRENREPTAVVARPTLFSAWSPSSDCSSHRLPHSPTAAQSSGRRPTSPTKPSVSPCAESRGEKPAQRPGPSRSQSGEHSKPRAARSRPRNARARTAMRWWDSSRPATRQKQRGRAPDRLPGRAGAHHPQPVTTGGVHQ